MKSTFTIILAFCFTTFATSTFAAQTSSEALSECKDHINSLYQDGLRTKVKRIKKRGGDYEVKIKVSAEGENFNAVCVFADGAMTFTTSEASSTAD